MVILDYTLFDFAGADELIVLQERFKEADWILFSDELSINFLRQVLFSSMAFGVVMKDNSKEEIMSALQCASRWKALIVAEANGAGTDVLPYFKERPWYLGTVEPEAFSEEVFSSTERENIRLIREMENDPERMDRWYSGSDGTAPAPYMEIS